MISMKISIIAAISLAVLATTSLAQSLGHDERCQIIEGNGVRVDQCDGTKLLSCRDGRCQCPDPANQVYTYRNEVVQNRVRRTPGKKGGGFKKVAVGAGVGAVAGIATYQVAKSAGKAFSTTPKPPKYQRVYSCYSRVGGQCALNYNNWETVEGTSTSTVAPAVSSTTEVSVNATTSSDNSTTTPAPSTTIAAAVPEAAAQVSKLDVSKIPRCVQYATCKHGIPTTKSTNETTSANDGFRQSVNFDPRLGQCVCEEGYSKNSRDLCEKQSRSAGNAITGASFAVLLSTLVIHKMFV